MIVPFVTRRLSSFSYFNLTQFLGALNDNIYKLLIVFFLIKVEGIEKSETILALSGAIFVLPFLLFSAYTGFLADKLSKRNIIVMCKVMEVVIMALGVAAFAYKSIFWAYVILFLMATQSAIFGPSKYGIVPELVASEKISKANGLLSSFTYFAVILGTFLASFVTDITQRNFILGGLFCTTISVVGMLASFNIEYTPPAGLQKKMNPVFLVEIYRTLRRAQQENTLFLAVCGSSFFLFAGAFIQLNIIPFTIQSLGLTEIEGGYLFLLTALGIGFGSFLAGKISGESVELGMVPLAGLLMSLCCFILDIFSSQIYVVVPAVTLLGIAGGLYLIPMDTFIQVASPNQLRGQVIAATNFLAFLGVLLASAMIFVISNVLGLQADKGFSILGVMTILSIIIITLHLRDYFIRFLGMILSKVFFKTEVCGAKDISPSSPSILVCYQHHWSDALMVLGSQRQRVHFFVEESKQMNRWDILQRRLLKITSCADLRSKNVPESTFEGMRHALSKGRSVCIFLKEDSRGPDVSELAAYYSQNLDHSEIPVFAVNVKKREKENLGNQRIHQLLRWLRVPAEVCFSKQGGSSS